MTIIAIDDAMTHLKAEAEDRALVESKLAAAEESAMQYLQRRFYADQTALGQAKEIIEQQLQANRENYQRAVNAANQLANKDDQQLALQYATEVFSESRTAVDAVARGIVINPAIKAACLLILGQLYENRGDLVDSQVDISNLPYGSKSLLIPYRIKMGV